MTAIAILHRDEIIEQVAAGEYLANIAKKLGLSGKGQAISNALANDPEYQAARELGLEAKMAAEENALRAAEPQAVPRARELLSHARWRCEREAPHRWGAKAQEVAPSVTIVIQRFGNDPGPVVSVQRAGVSIAEPSTE